MLKNVLRTAAGAAILTLGFFTTAQARDMQTLIVAGGCFWCVESDFESVPGVVSAVSGFTGGKMKDPTYKRHGQHYEAVEIRFDADKTSRRKMLDLFFRSIDPTDDGGQFCDRGQEYRTAVFVKGSRERQIAEAAKADAQAALGQRIVTQILPTQTFYPVGEYHQDYYKSQTKILTRFGPLTKAKAYKRYRKACGRDARVKALWGSAAPFAS